MSELEYYHYVGTADVGGNIYIPTSRVILAVSTNSSGCKASFFMNDLGMWYANITDLLGNPKSGNFELYMLVI